MWQVLDELESQQRPPAPADWDRLREQGVAATRQLAKRQLTWLRSMPERRVVACDQVDVLDQVLQLASVVWGPPAKTVP